MRWSRFSSHSSFKRHFDLAATHRARGEGSYIVSGALQEVVEALATELGLAGAAGSRCGIADGIYTGRLERACYGAEKAVALRDLAAREGIDLQASTAYSDSHTDLSFLEAVGRPVAVNPDRKLHAIARARNWRIVRFRTRLPRRHDL